MLAVVDYKVINLGSMINMLKRIGVKQCLIAEKPSDLDKATKIILPGVGSFASGLQQLHKQGFYSAIPEQVALGKPLLGVCLGMQLLSEGSEEGEGQGLGLIPGTVKKLMPQNNLPVPHMGWNEVKIANPSAITLSIHDESRFYFVHSYHFLPADPNHISLSCQYGGGVVAGVSRGNVHGVQFHPEKSHRFGMELLKSYIGTELCSQG